MSRPGRTLAAGLAFAVLAGCAHVEVDRRVDRGPTLRTFERELAAEGGLAGEVEATWPQLTVWVSAYDLCKVHKVEEYIEETITERSASSAGPSLALGVTTSLIGAGLLLARPAFSEDPNTGFIDPGGRYGPSTRQLATGWGIGLVIVGVPALVVGGIGYAQAGEEVQTRKAEQVLSATEQRCHQRPVEGSLELSDSRGPKGPVHQTSGGKAVFTADQVRGHAVDRLLFNGRSVELEPASASALEAFQACAALPPPTALEGLSLDALEQQLAQARLCRPLEGGPGGEAVKALEAEAQRRRADAPTGEAGPGPRLETFDDALAAYAPKLHFAEGSRSLAALARPDELGGQAATLTGILAERPEANIAVLQLGAQQVLLFVPPEVPWAFDFAVGTRVEVLGVAAGQQTLGTLTAPLFRAVWMRAAPAR